MDKTLETRDWFGIKIVRISSVSADFGKWLCGQTIPFIESELETEDGNPYDWAYYWDYERFVKNLPIID